MTALDALRAGLRTLRTRPAEILPYYLLAIGATMIARTPLTLGGGAALAILHVRGRIGPLVRALDDLDPAVEGGGLTQAQRDAVAGLVTPSVVLVVLLALLASLALYVLCRSGASAGTIHALFAALNDRDPLQAGATGIENDWRPFVAIGIARLFVYTAAGAGLALGVALSATLIGIVIGLPVLLVSLALLLVGHLLLAFAGQAVVVDDIGAVEAIGASVRFPLRAPTALLLYVGAGIAALLGLAIVIPLMQLAGIPRAAGLVVALGVAPALDAIKTGLYAGEADLIATEGADQIGAEHADQTVFEGPTETADTPAAERGDRSNQSGLVSQVLAGQRRGLGALAAFLRRHPLANLVGLVLFGAGTGLGWLLTAPYGTRLEGPGDVSGVFGEVAVGPFVNIAANNWQVAIGQAFGGLGLGVPTAANLLFNGVLVGALGGVFDRRVFLALVVPHGVVEVPALAVAGGVGLHLGVVGYRWLRGRVDAADVGQRLQRATWVLVGLLPLFVLAALIEAFVTPWIASLVLG